MRKKTVFSAWAKCSTCLFAGFLFLSTGCATTNDHLAKLPGFEAKTDKIPGIMPAQERIKAIRLKGEKGKTAAAYEREILLGQLLAEYKDSPDPLMRRETIEAIAKIPHSNRDAYLREALGDEDPFVRITTCKAFLEHEKNIDFERLAISAHALRKVMKDDKDKDVRTAAIKQLGLIGKKLADSTGKEQQEDFDLLVGDLGKMLEDKQTGIRYQAMLALRQCTGMDYGVDIDKWIEYIEYREGKAVAAPRERLWHEKVVLPKLPMFK